MSDSDDGDSIALGSKHDVERKPPEQSASKIHVEITKLIRRCRDPLNDAVQFVQESVGRSNASRGIPRGAFFDIFEGGRVKIDRPAH